MNWSAISFDWNRTRAVLLTIEKGSLSEAARSLRLTQPTLGRQVLGLEEELGVVLFERSGRELVPTPIAHEIAVEVRKMAEAANAISLIASGQSDVVDGTVRISATEMYSVMLLPDFVAKLREIEPGIVIDVVSTNALSDLRQREADIAIRNTDPKDPDMIARRLPDQKGGLFATPEFVENYGPFKTLADLKEVPFVGFGTESDFLQAIQNKGIPVSKDDLVAASESHTVHWELTKRGIGIGANGFDIGVLTPEVVPVLPDEVNFEFPVWLVAPRELKTSPRMRLVFDALADFVTEFLVENSI